MEKKTYDFKKIGTNEIEIIKELFAGVFTIEPWNDDWSNQEQLQLYLLDLIGQSNSLTYGLFENGKLIGVSMGHIKHWYSGTEYYIEETKTSSGRRYIPMTDNVFESLKNILAKRPKLMFETEIDGYSGFILLDKDNKPKVALHIENEMRWAMKKYKKEYKI